MVVYGEVQVTSSVVTFLFTPSASGSLTTQEEASFTNSTIKLNISRELNGREKVELIHAGVLEFVNVAEEIAVENSVGCSSAEAQKEERTLSALITSGNCGEDAGDGTKRNVIVGVVVGVGGCIVIVIVITVVVGILAVKYRLNKKRGTVRV